MMGVCRASVGRYDRNASDPASFQVMMAASGTSSYACFIYGTIPSASVQGYTKKITRVRALGLLTILTSIGLRGIMEGWNEKLILKGSHVQLVAL